MGVYRSTVSRSWHREEAEAEAAREILASHVLDRESGLCAVCLVPGPCGPANAAANRLVDLGRPVLPAHRPRRRRAGWRDWFRSATAAQGGTWAQAKTAVQPPRRAPLLTFVWLIRLGVVTTVPNAGVTP
ncbi:hypothetical protein [Micromonospora thermarum]|uniref:Uncharacterized protein n=1 Tax=Micromonospora thermarum TaxID=2720024 RepID=A0ABX0ZEA4_9ACTN|nr:hypothetical protein [Micromonospora thermarum]NJP34245.1 hypothetical protein [Micromonospora thermarum]